MFSQRKQPLLLVADRMLSLRLSLNTPVVSTPELPAGPARAAIAVHSEAGRPCFTVAVRSLRNGDSVLYELEGEDLEDADEMAVALDAALSFGESMGFLFDDELIASREEAVLRAAVRKLREIVAPPAPDVGETAPSLDLEGDAPDEILLEEEAPAPARGPLRQPVAAPEAPPPVQPLEGPSRLVEAAAPAPAPAKPVAPAPARAPAKAEPAPAPAKAAPAPVPAKPPAPQKTLTKFRAATEPAPAAASGEVEAPAPASAPAAPGATGGAMLGRVKPVRRRPPDAPPPVHPLLRLLAWF